MDVLHTCIAMVGVVALIIGLRINAVIALVFGCIYLGLTTGLGAEGTLTTVTLGFGEIMTEIGLLISFGILLGSLLSSMGAVQGLSELLLRFTGANRFPYALAGASSTVLPSIFADVQVVLVAPLVRAAGAKIGGHGLGLAAGAQTAGMLSGFAFVVPGAVVLTVSGIIGAPMGIVVLLGFIVGPLVALLTVFLWSVIVRKGGWNPETDETLNSTESGQGSSGGPQDVGHSSGVDVSVRQLPLMITLLPVLVPMVLIGASTILEVIGVESQAVATIGNPNVALFVGLLSAYILCRYSKGQIDADRALKTGFDTAGQVLLITGVGGALSAVIGTTDLERILSSLFSPDSNASIVGVLVLVYVIASVIHLVIGSVSVAAVTTAGLIAPLVGGLTVEPVFVVLAIGAGSLFAVHVNSNAFWMFSTLMRLTAKGTLKALTLVSAMTSVISMPIIIGLAIVFSVF